MACLVTYCRVGSVKADCRWHNFAGVLVVGVGRGRELFQRRCCASRFSLSSDVCKSLHGYGDVPECYENSCNTITNLTTCVLCDIAFDIILYILHVL